MLGKLAIRNLLRQRRRSLLTGLTMSAGFVVLAFSLALTEGAYDRIIEVFTDFQTAHLQIVHHDYQQSPSLHETVAADANFFDRLSRYPGVQGVAGRLEGGALASWQEATVGVQLLGVDPVRDPEVSSLHQRLAQGQWLQERGERQLILGAKAARLLNVQLGDSIVLLSQGADGSLSNDQFSLVGLLKENLADDFLAISDESSISDFWSLRGRWHRILLKTAHYSKAHQLKDRLSPTLSLPDTASLQTWDELESDFVRSMEQDKAGNVVLYVIIGAVVALGTLNTVLMSLLERRREFGILRALGTRPHQLLAMILTEVLSLALVSCALASVLALGINAYFAQHGIRLGASIEFGGILLEEFVASPHPRHLLLPLLIIIGAALFVALLPAWKVSRTKPLEAMRRV